MISEFKIKGAHSGDILKIAADDSDTYHQWIQLRVNEGKIIEVQVKEILRALKAISID